MATSLTPNSRVIKVISSHIEDGLPIDPNTSNLTPDEVLRIKAVFHLYKVWRKNPFVDKRTFLMEVYNRKSKDLANDLYCFNYIHDMTSDLTLSRADAEFIMDKYTKKILQAGDTTGDAHLWESGLKLLGKYHKLDKEMPPEDVASRTATLPYVITRDIKAIDPNREQISLEHKNKIIAKYGGKPDATAEKIRVKRAEILGLDLEKDKQDGKILTIEE